MKNNLIDYSRFKCAIFDLDGTLIDSNNIWGKVDEEFFARRNMKEPEGFLEEIKTHTLYSGAEYIIERCGLDETVDDIVAEWVNGAKEAYAHNTFAKPYAREYIRFLKENYNYKIALATSSDRMLYTDCLINNDMYELFDTFTQTDEVGKRKGYPDIYELAAARTGVEPKDCIVYEDVLLAVRGAKLGDFFTVAVRDEASVKDEKELREEADIYISSYKELMNNG